MLGSGKTNVLNDDNVKKEILNMGITTVDVEENCFAVAVLAAMKMSNNSEEGNIFLANQKNFSVKFANN